VQGRHRLGLTVSWHVRGICNCRPFCMRSTDNGCGEKKGGHLAGQVQVGFHHLAVVGLAGGRV
jgi:hypothetical protein